MRKKIRVSARALIEGISFPGYEDHIDSREFSSKGDEIQNPDDLAKEVVQVLSSSGLDSEYEYPSYISVKSGDTSLLFYFTNDLWSLLYRSTNGKIVPSEESIDTASVSELVSFIKNLVKRT